MKKSILCLVTAISMASVFHAKQAFPAVTPEWAGSTPMLSDVISDGIYSVVGAGELAQELSVVMDIAVIPSLSAIAVNPLLVDNFGNNLKNMGNGDFRIDREGTLDLFKAAGLSTALPKDHNWLLPPRTIKAKHALNDLAVGLRKYYELAEKTTNNDFTMKLGLHALVINTFGRVLDQIGSKRSGLSMVGSDESYLFSFWWVMAAMNRLLALYNDGYITSRRPELSSMPIAEAAGSVTGSDELRWLNHKMKVVVMRVEKYNSVLQPSRSEKAVAGFVTDFIHDANDFLVLSYRSLTEGARFQLDDRFLTELVYSLTNTAEALGCRGQSIVGTVEELKAVVEMPDIGGAEGSDM